MHNLLRAPFGPWEHLPCRVALVAPLASIRAHPAHSLLRSPFGPWEHLPCRVALVAPPCSPRLQRLPLPRLQGSPCSLSHARCQACMCLSPSGVGVESSPCSPCLQGSPCSLSHARCQACMCLSPSGVGVESSSCSPLQGSPAHPALAGLTLLTLSCTMSSMHVSVSLRSRG
jgi:hypothetical protein